MRLRQMISLAKQEIRAVRDASKVSGVRDALITRARHDLDLDEIDANRIGSLESRLAALEAASPDIGAVVAELRENRVQLQGAEVQLRATVESLSHVEATMQVKLAQIDRRDELTALAARIGPVTTWVRNAQLSTTSRITVLMATYNRCELLRRAVDSVRAQQYSNWELVIVDDGSSDETPALLTRFASEDDRKMCIRDSCPRERAPVRRNRPSPGRPRTSARWRTPWPGDRCGGPVPVRWSPPRPPASSLPARSSPVRPAWSWTDQRHSR